MTRLQLVFASLRFHARSHWGVFLGAAVATAVLVGALTVGDSVRVSLRQKALNRLAGFDIALHSNDRFFTAGLTERLTQAPGLASAGLHRLEDRLLLPGNLARQDGEARANRVSVLGVDVTSATFVLPEGQGEADREESLWLSAALADQVKARPGDTFILRLHKPSALSRDAIVTPRNDASVALRLRFQGVVPAVAGGDFALQSGQGEPFNVFVSRKRLAASTGLEGKANLMLGQVSLDFVKSGKGLNAVVDEAQRLVRTHWQLEDAELTLSERSVPGSIPGSIVPQLELHSTRIFLDPAALAAVTNTVISGAAPRTVLTYLVNGLFRGEKLVPYSMVAAGGDPWTPADLKDGEIVINEWLAKELGIGVGDSLQMSYYRADSAASLVESTNQFRVRRVVPMAGVHADRALMPEFPGLTKAESTHDWDAGFELIHKVRDPDEAYWKEWRGTPKAFVSLQTGQKLWGNRFGNATAVRWIPAAQDTGGNAPAFVGSQVQAARDGLLKRLNPVDFSLQFRDMKTPALTSAAGGQDFGQLFVGFSFFLIVSAVLLTAMLFRFSLEQRANELGLLLAVGWSMRAVRRVYLCEGIGVSLGGAVLGAVAASGYGAAVIGALNTLWRAAVGGTGFEFHATTASILGGALGSVLIAAAAMAWTLRSAGKRPARELLNEGWSTHVASNAHAGRGRLGPVLISVLGLGMVASGLFVPPSQRAGIFFGSGALILIAGLLWVRVWLRRDLGALQEPARELRSLAARAASRNPSRSLATIALLASATFLIVAVGANKLDAGRDATQRGAGTGGFAFWGESSLPIVQDLNTAKGQELAGLDPRSLASRGVRFVSFRVRDGDEASCLNLNQALRPRILGVAPAELAGRGAFTFTGVDGSGPNAQGWERLNLELPPSGDGVPEFPAVGDAQSIQWAMKKKLGDTVEYTDERGAKFRLRLVGAVANSILQGNLLMDETVFAKLFPSESGRRVFLVDVDRAVAGEGGDAARTAVAADLSRSLQDAGLELVPTATRLNRFNAVQNTYLDTFQILGGLGLILGSIGLGVVVLRNVFERRAEFGVMQAVGFNTRALRRMIVLEHRLLLMLGIGLGAFSSLIVLLPIVFQPGNGGVPLASLAGTLLVVVCNGLVWTAWASRRAMKGSALSALRGE